MPPAQKKTEAPEGLLKIGAIVNVVFGSRTHTGYEVLDQDEHFIKFRGNMTVAPQTEVVLVPRGKIEAIGLTDER
jgi:hypothetical protein